VAVRDKESLRPSRFLYANTTAAPLFKAPVAQKTPMSRFALRRRLCLLGSHPITAHRRWIGARRPWFADTGAEFGGIAVLATGVRLYSFAEGEGR
jgi:hypothetical protein